MNLGFIIFDFVASFKNWYRSKGTIFWTIAFPVILILMFGAIFSGTEEISYELYVKDLDNSEASHGFIKILKNLEVLKIINVTTSEDVNSYMEKNNVKRLIVIPENYEENLFKAVHSADKNMTVNILFYFDPSEQQTNQVVRNIISNVVQSMNINMSGGKNIVGIKDIETISENLSYIDFFIPGMIGFTIMQTCIYGSIERNTKYRKDGILRKLLTTPVTRVEWIFSKMFFMLFLSFVSTFSILTVGVLVWGLTVNINPLMVVIIVATSFLFSGVGMLIGRFVKEEETADTAGGAISFPMMFLAGTFFPLEQMPGFLQSFARVLPLYYVNEGLRNAMIYLDQSEAVIDTVFVIIFAVIFFVTGVFLTKWQDE